ncbi:MAG: DinB superfamily protein [Flavipsychrobacter sp.]|nr:DinB superfamily protein [Flavipsychrobacter sp.]
MNTTIAFIIRQYDFNLLYAKALVTDVPEEVMTFVPSAGLLNHPAFTIGHLITGSAMMAEDLGSESVLPEGWAELFQRKGPNDQKRPDEDKTKYPTKAALLNELERQHESVKELLLSVSEKKLAEPVKWRFGIYMPTLLDLILFMCVSHESMHLGQLAAWRRALNMPAALGTL